MNEPSLLVPHWSIYIAIGPEATGKGGGHVRIDNNTKTITANLRICLCAFLHKNTANVYICSCAFFFFSFPTNVRVTQPLACVFIGASIVLRHHSSPPHQLDTVASNASSRQRSSRHSTVQSGGGKLHLPGNCSKVQFRKIKANDQKQKENTITFST